MSTSGRAALAGALLALVCAIAFPLAPVHQPTVDYAWPGPATPPGPSTTALPLMPYQPISLDARLTCDAVRSVPVGAPVLATTPPQTPDGPVAGLRVVRTPGGVSVTSNGVRIADAALGPGPCTVAVSSTPSSTRASADGRVLGAVEADVRPVVAAVVAPSRAGITLGLRTDTRFETTPTGLKIAFGVGALLGLALLLAGALASDVTSRAPNARRAAFSRRLPRPRVLDVVVTLGLAAWAVVGPASVDDGYIAGMVRSRGENGVLGNVYRWLNAPEAPFSWFYEVERAWAALHPGEAASVLWLRVPATVLGVLTWLLVSRHVLPRLGPALRRPSALWIAAIAFAAWWLPFGLTLRPEPWVATGTVAVWVATERAVATRRLFPLAVAALLGGLTVALTPGALGGLVPLLVALPVLARGVRGAAALRAKGTLDRTGGSGGTVARDDGGRGSCGREALLRVAVVAGAGAIAVLPMAVDQSLGGILESTRVRQVIGGGLPWYEEFQRYTTLLTPDDPQGSLALRLPVLLLLLALGALAWSRRRPGAGIAPGTSGRLLATVAVTLVLLAFSPTKWTLHFGSLAGLGTATVTLFVVAYSPRALRTVRAPMAVLGVLAATLLTGALVLAGDNQWFYSSAWGVFWSTIRPQVARIELADVVLYAGLVVVIATAVVLAVRTPSRTPRWMAPGVVAMVLAVAVVALVGGSFLKVTVDRAGTYSLGSDSLDALRGDPCGMASDLRVETDPRAGLLPPGPSAPVLDGFTPTTGPGAVELQAAGEPLPGWSSARGGTMTSGWYALPDDARRQEAPVVVTVSGSTVPRSGVRLEFTTDPAGPVTAETPVGDTPPSTSSGSFGGTAPRDLRALAPAGVTLVRVVATSAPQDDAAAAASTPGGAVADTPLAVSAPRVPRTVPFDDAVPTGAPVLADWPVGLAFPCERLPALSGGVAEVPAWRLVTPGQTDAGEITVAPATGGPFLTPRMLVDEVRVPVVLTGDPTRDAVGLVRWVPREPLATLAPVVGDETVAGWARDGRATVPVLDTP